MLLCKPTYLYAFVYIVSSVTSTGSTKYDPDLLRQDVALAHNRLARLKRELRQIETEMVYKERGLCTLTQ